MSQGIEVIYSNETVKCLICNKEEKSNGKMFIMKNCKHHYHISCILDHVIYKDKLCPVCHNSFDDIRISIATAFRKNNLQELIDVLL